MTRCTSGMRLMVLMICARCVRPCTCSSIVIADESVSRSCSCSLSMFVPLPATFAATAASTPTRLLISSWISELNVRPPVASQATDSHFSGCLRYSARLPQFWRWIITPRPAERYAMIGSFGIGKQQRA